MKNKLKKIISEIEREENIRVLFLVESGSRAWGWESEDSDYDIRGVYIQNYNQFKNFKMQINKVEGNLDIELWDLKKFLSLFIKSNPSTWEWLSSDMIYLEHKIRRELKEEFIKGCSRFALKKHYCSMAKQNFHKYVSMYVNSVNLKKYVYVLRSIACINYLEQENLPPPKNYKEVIKYLPPSVETFFEKIIENKRKSESLVGERDFEIEDYIVSFFDKQFERDNSKFTKVRQIFAEVIKNV